MFDGLRRALARRRGRSNILVFIAATCRSKELREGLRALPRGLGDFGRLVNPLADVLQVRPGCRPHPSIVTKSTPGQADHADDDRGGN